MFKKITKRWIFLFCLLVGLGAVWRVRLSSQFYARDMSSGLLLGPFRLKNGVIVETGAGGFRVTAPQPGELEVMDRLRSIIVDVRFCGQSLSEAVDILMVKQESVMSSSHVIPISLHIDPRWSTPQQTFRFQSGQEGSKWVETPRILPTVAFAEQKVSLLDVLRDIQSIVGYPLILKIDQGGVVLWLRFPPQSD